MRIPGHRLQTGALAVVAVSAVTAALVLGLAGGSDRGGVAAAADVSADPGTVSVSGVGTVQGVPDTLTAMLSVHVTRDSVQSALDGVTTAAGHVLSALARAGVPRHRVQTSSLQVYPHYGDHGTITGYDASESVTARISPLKHAGATLSSAIGSAGNAVSVDGLSFDIVDDDALLQRARAEAFDNAKARAQQYAGLSGRSLGRVEKISETVQAPERPVPYADALGLAASAGVARAVPIRAGQQPVQVTVTVVWNLH